MFSIFDFLGLLPTLLTAGAIRTEPVNLLGNWEPN